jgi:hypothetical protein
MFNFASPCRWGGELLNRPKHGSCPAVLWSDISSSPTQVELHGSRIIPPLAGGAEGILLTLHIEYTSAVSLDELLDHGCGSLCPWSCPWPISKTLRTVLHGTFEIGQETATCLLSDQPYLPGLETPLNSIACNWRTTIPLLARSTVSAGQMCWSPLLRDRAGMDARAFFNFRG